MTRKADTRAVVFATSSGSTSFKNFCETAQAQCRKGRAWSFKQLYEECDTPGANSIQAVLIASDAIGFALYARQDMHLHRITRNDNPVIFRTIEQALDTLADVPHLYPEIAIDMTSW